MRLSFFIAFITIFHVTVRSATANQNIEPEDEYPYQEEEPRYEVTENVDDIPNNIPLLSDRPIVTNYSKPKPINIIPNTNYVRSYIINGNNKFLNTSIVRPIINNNYNNNVRNSSRFGFVNIRPTNIISNVKPVFENSNDSNLNVVLNLNQTVGKSSYDNKNNGRNNFRLTNKINSLNLNRSSIIKSKETPHEINNYKNAIANNNQNLIDILHIRAELDDQQTNIFNDLQKQYKDIPKILKKYLTNKKRNILKRINDEFDDEFYYNINKGAFQSDVINFVLRHLFYKFNLKKSEDNLYKMYFDDEFDNIF